MRATNTDSRCQADLGSLAAVVVSLGVGLAALPALPADVAIHWNTDGSSNTLVPALPGLLVIPTAALLAFAYLRGGAFLPGGVAKLGPSTGLGVVAGVAALQASLAALNLGLVTNPLVAVLPAVLVILAATYADRISAIGDA